MVGRRQLTQGDSPFLHDQARARSSSHRLRRTLETREEHARIDPKCWRHMSGSKERVLIVDDEFLIAELFSILVEEIGLEVCGRAATAEQAVEFAKSIAPCSS